MSGSRAERFGVPKNEPNFTAETRLLKDLLITKDVILPVMSDPFFFPSEERKSFPHVRVETIYQDGVTYRGEKLNTYSFHTSAVAVHKELYPLGDMYAMNIAHLWNQQVTGHIAGNSDFRIVATMVSQDQYYNSQRVSPDPLPPIHPELLITKLILHSRKLHSDGSYELVGMISSPYVQQPQTLPRPSFYTEELRGLMDLPENLEKTLRSLLSHGIKSGFEWPPDLQLKNGLRFPNQISARGDFLPEKEMYRLKREWMDKRDGLIQVSIQIGAALSKKKVDVGRLEIALEDLHYLYPDFSEVKMIPDFSNLDFDPQKLLEWIAKSLYRIVQMLLVQVESGEFDAQVMSGVAKRFNLVSQWLDLQTSEGEYWSRELGLR